THDERTEADQRAWGRATERGGADTRCCAGTPGRSHAAVPLGARGVRPIALYLLRHMDEPGAMRHGWVDVAALLLPVVSVQPQGQAYAQREGSGIRAAPRSPVGRERGILFLQPRRPHPG